MPTNKHKAHSMVAAAIKNKDLPVLDGSIKCADCPKPATQYDHRDYDRPLMVEPVCAACNRRRGAGLNGLNGRRRSVRARQEFHRAMKELALKEGRDIGEAVEWLCRDGLLYREEHKDNYIP